MMPKSLAVGRNRKRGAGFEAERSVGQPFGQAGAIGQPVAERDRRGEFAIVAEDRETQFASAPLEGTGGARLSASAAEVSLIRREDNELDSGGGGRPQRIVICSALGDPHPGPDAPEGHGGVLG